MSAETYLAKRRGEPIVTRKTDAGMVHERIDTALEPQEILARRQQGLREAMRFHRHENPRDWLELVEAIPCPFARDEAQEYLRGILIRSRTIAAMTRE